MIFSTYHHFHPISVSRLFYMEFERVQAFIPRFEEGCELMVKQRLLGRSSRVMLVMSVFWVSWVSKIQFHPTITVTLL